MSEAKSKTKLQIEFSDSASESFQIHYVLNDLRITKKWITEFKNHFSQNQKIAGQGFFFGSHFYSGEYLVNEMNTALLLLRRHFGDFLANCPVPQEPVSQAVLSEIHNYFEGLDQQPNWLPVVSIHDEVHPTAQRLNLLIHMYECLPAPPENFHVDINFEPTMKWPIDTADFQEMEWNKADGDLLISYGTTGVPPLLAWNFGPPSIPTFQTTYSCDLQLHFEGPMIVSSQEAFDRWLLKEHQIDRTKTSLHPGQFKIGELAQGETKAEILKSFSRFKGPPVISSVTILPKTN